MALQHSGKLPASPEHIKKTFGYRGTFLFGIFICLAGMSIMFTSCKLTTPTLKVGNSALIGFRGKMEVKFFKDILITWYTDRDVRDTDSSYCVSIENKSRKPIGPFDFNSAKVFTTDGESAKPLSYFCHWEITASSEKGKIDPGRSMYVSLGHTDDVDISGIESIVISYPSGRPCFRLKLK